MIDLTRLDRYRENNRIEAKLARGGLPHSIWETYSAFANSYGGLILLGVEEFSDKSLHAIDLPEPEAVIEEFWQIVNDPTRVSANILSPHHVTVEEVGVNRIVVVRVPRAPLRQRPVYIGKDPMSGSYKRGGEGDYKCTEEEVRAMMAATLGDTAEPPGETAVKYRAAVEYLTEHISASRAELAAHLRVAETEVELILRGLTERGLIVPIGSRKHRRYRLRA